MGDKDVPGSHAGPYPGSSAIYFQLDCRQHHGHGHRDRDHDRHLALGISTMEAVEPTRPIIVRRGGLQQQQPSSTWTSLAPSWFQNGIQTLKQTVFGPSNPPSQHEILDSLLGKRSAPADDRDPGPTPKRARRESPPAQTRARAQALQRRTDSLEPHPSRIQMQHSVRLHLPFFPLLALCVSLSPLLGTIICLT